MTTTQPTLTTTRPTTQLITTTRSTTTTTPATCNDGVRNGGESGIDCDGPCVKRCNGRACSSPDHCWSGVCGTNQTCS
ncbi:unnamed protein product, partial [Rotaria sp. Silwood1]